MTEKTDLQAEAKKLGLDTSGTTKELKARIAAAAGTDPVEEDTKPTETKSKPAKNDFNISTGYTDKGHPWATSNRFSVGGTERYGLRLIGISSTNHVGPAPLVVPASELRELATLLTQLADAETPEEK